MIRFEIVYWLCTRELYENMLDIRWQVITGRRAATRVLSTAEVAPCGCAVTATAELLGNGVSSPASPSIGCIWFRYYNLWSKIRHSYKYIQMSVFLLVPGTNHGPCRAPGNSESARSKVRWSKGAASRLPCLIFDEEEARPHYQTAAQERRPQQSPRGPSCTGGPGEGFAFALDHTPSRERGGAARAHRGARLR
jgi:hypothetical protein